MISELNRKKMAVLSIYRYHHTETEYLNVTDPVINSRNRHNLCFAIPFEYVKKSGP